MIRETETEGRLKVYLFCRFHLAKLFRLHPLSSAVLCVAVAAAATGLGLLLYWSDRHRNLEEELRIAPRHVAPKTTIAGAQRETPQLPNYSSAEFTGQFVALVKEIGLSTDELTYSLEAGAGVPYWRYRISLQVQSGYPAIRKFLAAISSQFPNIVLDAIQCKRERTLQLAR